MRHNRLLRPWKHRLAALVLFVEIVALAAGADAAGRAFPDDEREARQYEQAVYLGEEPTFEKVASFYAPIKYPNAIVGADGYPGEAYVAFSGDVVLPIDPHYPGKVGDGVYLQFALDWPPVFAGDRGTIKRSLEKGYLPVVTTQWEKDNLTVTSRVFASRLRDDVMVVFVRITVANRANQPQAVRFSASVGRVVPTDKPEAATARSWPYACPLRMKDEKVLLETRSGMDRVVGVFEPAGRWHTRYDGEAGVAAPAPRDSQPARQPSLSNVMEYSWQIPPGATREAGIRVPFYPMPVQYEPDLVAMKEEDCLARCRSDWDRFLAQGAQFRIPERVIAEPVKTFQINNQIMTDEFGGQRLPSYGAYTYDGITYDFEGEEFLEALDLYGRHAEARRCLEELLARGEKRAVKPAGAFAEPEGWLGFGDADLYAFGSAGSRAICEHFRMTGDAEWLRRMSPRLLRAAAWIRKARATTRQLDDKGNKPPHYGLIPKGAWCDIIEREYWFFVSALYYRSLHDMAEVLRRIGAPEAAQLAAEAREFREDILRAVDQCVDRRSDPPFVPLAPYVSQPSFDQPDLQSNRYGMYWSIVGPHILMHCGVLDPGDRRATWILKWLEQRNGLLLGVARFGGGGDPKYTYVTAMTNLRRGEVTKALLSLYGLLAHGMSRDTCSTPEVYDGLKTGAANPSWWVPCLPDRFSNVRYLSLVRHLLVREEGDVLHLLDGTPRSWLADGKEVEIAGAPTHFGPASLKATSRAARGEICCEIRLPQRSPPKKAVLRLRHPGSLPLKRVTVNGQPWPDFDAKQGLIRLPDKQQELVVAAIYR